MTLNNDDLLVSAAGAGRLSDVRELLEKGANIEARDSDGYTSLHRAAEGGHLEIIRFLIDKRANIGAKNKDGKNPLDVANDLGKTEVVNFLGPKQSEYDRLLFAAVESGNVSEVTNLLNIGANIEARGAKNETPLCAASRINKLDVLELLLSRNANVNVQDDDRRTPLHHAAYLGKGVELILDKGANIEAKDINDWTPLHYAAWGGQSDTVKTLVNKWANIGAKNKDGGKPLDVANTSRQSEVVNFLGPKQSEYDRLLFAAVESGNVSEVTNLLTIGASIEVKGVENAEFRLARYVKRIMEMSNYHNVHSEKKSELERIKGELPESVKNAVFSSEVCIKSVYYSNEYLYPASDYLSHDRDRRRVFTWRPGGKDSSCQWKFEPEGNNIYIKSTYFNEYLYPAGNGLSHDRDRRRVFTWRPGGKDSPCQWKIEDCGSTRKKRDVQYSITKEAKCDLSYDNASDNSSQSDEIGYNKIGATSGASKPSSWIDAVKGVFQFISSPLRAALPSFSENSSSRSGTAGSSSNHSDTVRNPNIQYTSQFSREVCASNNASLMFFLLQAFLDKKCPLPKFSDVIALSIKVQM